MATIMPTPTTTSNESHLNDYDPTVLARGGRYKSPYQYLNFYCTASVLILCVCLFKTCIFWELYEGRSLPEVNKLANDPGSVADGSNELGGEEEDASGEVVWRFIVLFASLSKVFFSNEMAWISFTLLFAVTIPINLLHIATVWTFFRRLTFAEKNHFQTCIFSFTAFKMLTASRYPAERAGSERAMTSNTP